MDDNWLTDWLTDLLIDYKIIITKSVIIPAVSGLYRPTGLLFILMIEEHVSFHFQQLSSWINRVLMCYFTFLKVEKSGIFFWKPEIRPTLTAQKKYSKVCLGFNFFSHDEAACQFSFQSLLSTITHLFDILFDFPGGRKIRKILPGFSRSHF